MKKVSPARFLAIAILAALVGVAPSYAQPMGAVSGIVVDDDNDPIDSMTVRVTDLIDSSKVYFATSANDGTFSLSSLPVGTYVVAAETANTQWVQKHDSPVVKVTPDGNIGVKLVLVNLAGLGVTTDLNPIQIGTLAAAIGGVITGIIAINKAEDAESAGIRAGDLARDNANRLNDVLEDLQRLQNQVGQNSEDLDQIQEELDRLQEELMDLSDDVARLDRRLADEIDNLNDQLEDIQDQIDETQDLICPGR